MIASPRTPRVLIGPEATRAADKLQKDRQAAWPYEHLFPPPGSKPVHQIAAIPTPAQDGNLHTVLSYRVEEGMNFWLVAILQEFTLNGTPGPFNPGDALWTVDVNTPVGIPNVQAMPVQGLAAVPVPLGSWVYGTEWPFVMPYKFSPLDLVQSKVQNVNLGVGAPNYVTSGFFGFLVPAL